MTSKPLTLAEKVWNDHLVVKGKDGSPDLLYIDLHLVHEVTSHKLLMVCALPVGQCVAQI